MQWRTGADMTSTSRPLSLPTGSSLGVVWTLPGWLQSRPPGSHPSPALLREETEAKNYVGYWHHSVEKTAVGLSYTVPGLSLLVIWLLSLSETGFLLCRDGKTVACCEILRQGAEHCAWLTVWFLDWFLSVIREFFRKAHFCTQPRIDKISNFKQPFMFQQTLQVIPMHKKVWKPRQHMLISDSLSGPVTRVATVFRIIHRGARTGCLQA